MARNIEYIPFYALKSYSDCQKAWEFVFVDGIKPTLDPGLLTFYVFKNTIELCFAEKMNIRGVIDDSIILSTFEDSWSSNIESNYVNWGDISPAQVKNDCYSRVSLYMDRMWDVVEPLQVNVSWGIRILTTKVAGRVSMFLGRNRYLDVRYSSKSLPQSELDNDMKGSALAAAFNNNIQYHVHTAVMKQKPDVDYKHTDKTTEDGMIWISVVEKIITQMQTGIAVPNRGSWKCDPRYCSFYDMCTEDLSKKTFNF